MSLERRGDTYWVIGDALILFWAAAMGASAIERARRRQARWWAGADAPYSPLRDVDPFAWIARKAERRGKPWRPGTALWLSLGQAVFAALVAGLWFAAK